MDKYRVSSTPDKRNELRLLVTAGKAAARKLAHAQIVLPADGEDQQGPWRRRPDSEAIELEEALTYVAKDPMGVIDTTHGRNCEPRPARAPQKRCSPTGRSPK
jgi:hypothetical protein